MKKNHFSPIYILALALIVLSLLTGCGQSVFAKSLSNQSTRVNLTPLSADDISAYRWEALGRFYAADPYEGVNLTTLGSNDAMIFRWIAMTRVYERLGVVDK